MRHLTSVTFEMSAGEEVTVSQRRFDLIGSLNRLIRANGRGRDWRVHSECYREFLPLRFRGRFGHRARSINLKRLSQLMAATVDEVGQGWTVRHWDYEPSVFVSSREGDKEMIVTVDGHFTLIGYESAGADRIYDTLEHLECLLRCCETRTCHCDTFSHGDRK
jgi:hypothetical protein